LLEEWAAKDKWTAEQLMADHGPMEVQVGKRPNGEPFIPYLLTMMSLSFFTQLIPGVKGRRPEPW
jgi:hypothetical protein